VTLIVPSTVKHPKLSVSSDLALAWGRVTPNRHALRRSIYPGEQPSGLLLDDCEPVPELGYVTLRAVEVSVDSLASGVYNDADHWRRITTPATRGVYWYQYAVAEANATAGYSRPPLSYYMEPGVMIRWRTYGLPAGQTESSYVYWQFQDDDDTTWFNLYWLRAYPVASGSDQREGWYLTRGSDIIDYYSGGPGLTPGADVQMRVRVIDDRVIVTGQNWGSPWVVRLPDNIADPLKACKVWCHVKGGMFLWHVNPMIYTDTGNVIEAQTLDRYYAAPPHVAPSSVVTPSAAMTQVPAAGGSGGVAASVLTSGDLTRLKAVLTGTAHTSPKLIAITEQRDPVLASASSSATTLNPSPVAADIKLTKEGRGQTCVLTFADTAGANQAALGPGRVVTVSGNYDDGTANVTLFKGRVMDPLTYSKEHGRLQDYQVGIVDAAWELSKKPMVALTGTFAGETAEDAATELLTAAGVAAGRMAVTADSTAIMPQGRDNLRHGPTDTILRALDSICKARGDWCWWCDRDGDFYVGPKSAYGVDQGTIADSDTTFETYLHEITHEQSLNGEFANSVIVINEPRGKPEMHVYAPTPGAEGIDLWYVAEEDVDNGTDRARELYAELSGKLQTVSWSQHVDFANLVAPWDTFTTGTLADIDLDAALTLRVEEVRLHIDAEAVEKAVATYIATVETS
jgi:hypothetical protein